jgi:hypothetical protein
MKKSLKNFLPSKMNYKMIAVTFGCILSLFANQAKAQNKRWNIDASVVGAAVFKITQAKATYILNPKSKYQSEVGVGFLLQPASTAKANEAFNNDGIYSAKMATIAYRQYFWKGLHFEEDVNFGQGAISNNVIDGKTYKEFVVFTQSFIGYKFDLCKKEKYNIFLIGQGGFGYAYNANHWPSNGSPSFYGLGDLKFGINF